MKMIAIVTGAAVVAIVVTGCESQATRSAAAPTVTHTVTAPGPTVTAPGPTVTAPGPTVTAPGPTVSAPGATATSTVHAQAPSQTSSATPTPSPGTNRVIVRFSGTGSQNTATFTTPASWHLSWAYWGCPGGTANFVVNEYNSDGSPDFNGAFVNELGTGRGPVATHVYGDAGTHYLSVDTEGCSWSLVPVTG